MILQKTVIKAKELPETLRAGIDPESLVLVSVRSITENGFTEEFEQSVLEAEKEENLSPPMSGEDFLKELKAQTSQ